MLWTEYSGEESVDYSQLSREQDQRQDIWFGSLVEDAGMVDLCTTVRSISLKKGDENRGGKWARGGVVVLYGHVVVVMNGHGAVSG